MGMGGQHHAPAALPRHRAPVPTEQETWWAPGPVSKGVEKIKSLTPTGARTPNRPGRSESQYRLTDCAIAVPYFFLYLFLTKATF